MPLVCYAAPGDFGGSMANRIRLFVALAVLVGISGEFWTGMLPARSTVIFSQPPQAHLVDVSLPSLDQALAWCRLAEGRPLLACRAFR